jgi:hypothetical protein
MHPMAPVDLTLLESLIDKYGLDAVLLDLSRICDLKADQVARWNDTPQARLWAEIGAAVDVIITKANRL